MLDAIPLPRYEPHHRARPQHAASESAHSMSSRVNKIDINETSRPTNKRPPAHFPDDAAQRSKRTPSGTLERHLSSFSQGHEKKSTTSGLKYIINPKETTLQPISRLGRVHFNARDSQRASFPSYAPRNLSAQALGLTEEQSWPSPPSSPVNTYNEQEGGILLQPETRPITQEQLVNEVKGVFVCVFQYCLI